MGSKSENRRINLYINGKEVKNNIRSIKNEYFKLINQQSRMTRGTKEYYEAAKSIKKLKGLMDEHNKQLGRMGKMWGNLKTLVFGVVGGNLITSWFNKITSFIPDMIKRNGDLSDSFADVAKTTELEIAEVKELNRELKKLNTRTARKELLDLARIGGKLGVRGKADLLGFVRAADQIGVSLNEDLGGNTDEAVRQLGKLADVFKLKDKFGLEQSLLKTGSAINALGADSTANEAYIVEFTKRVAGVAPMADISIESVLGLAATLDQLGQTSEVSSTVYSQVIPNMFKDTATYASVAGMEVGEFSDLLKKDANEAFIKVLEGLNGNNAGMEVMVKKLDELGLGGKRTISVLGVLSNNTEMLRDQQKLANEEFEKGTSLTKEFNIKNNTLGANLDKIGKKLAGIFVNSQLISGIENVVGTFAKWIEIPVSEQMDDQRIKANALAIELTNTNTTAQRRNDIYNELKGISPDIIKGIDAENISVETLRLNLAKYNDEMIKKIAIQESEETLQEKREEYGKKIGERVEAENKLAKDLLKLKEKVQKSDKERAQKIDEILISEIDILEKEKQIRAVVEDYNKKLGYNAIIVTHAYNTAYKVKNLKEDELGLQDDLNQSLKEYQELYDRIFGKVPVGGGNGNPNPNPDDNSTFTQDAENSPERILQETIEKVKTLSNEYIEIEDETDRIILRKREEFIDHMEALADQERFISEERLNLAGTFVNGFANLLYQDENNRRKYAGLIKALGIAEVGINLYKELSYLSMAAAANPLNAITAGAAGTAQYSVQSSIAIARAAFATGQILTAKYAKGGFTNGPRYYEAGEAGREYIAPNWQLNDPITGPIIEGLDRIRTGNASSSVFQPPVNNGISPQTINNYNNNDSRLDVLIAQNDELLGYLSDPKNRRVGLNHDDLTRYEEELEEVRGLAEIK